MAKFLYYSYIKCKLLMIIGFFRGAWIKLQE